MKEKADAAKKLCEEIQDLQTKGAELARLLKGNIYSPIANGEPVNHLSSFVGDMELPAAELLRKIGELRKLVRTL